MVVRISHKQPWGEGIKLQYNMHESAYSFAHLGCKNTSANCDKFCQSQNRLSNILATLSKPFCAALHMSKCGDQDQRDGPSSLASKKPTELSLAPIYTLFTWMTARISRLLHCSTEMQENVCAGLRESRSYQGTNHAT